MSPFDRLWVVMTKPSIAITYVGFIVLSFLYFDKSIAFYFHSIHIKATLPMLSWITKLGLGGVYLPGFFLLALFFRYIRVNRDWEARAWFLFTCVVIPSLICGFLKMLLGRARPIMLFKEDLYGFYGLQTQVPFWSFPSGHTTTIISAALGLSIVFPRYCYAFILTGLTVAFSRVLLTQHYLSDVMAASYLTLLEIGFLLCVLRRKSWLEPAWGHAV